MKHIKEYHGDKKYSNRYIKEDRWIYDNAEAAFERLVDIYDKNTHYLKEHYMRFCQGEALESAIEAHYPEIRFYLEKMNPVSSILSHGFLEQIGFYAASITKPLLFKDYLCEQIALIMKNHAITVEIGVSDTPIPIKFVEGYDEIPIAGLTQERIADLHHLFSPVNTDLIDDSVADGISEKLSSGAYPLSLFDAVRVDIALQRLEHYTGCKAEEFQDFIILTNYSFHVEYFIQFALHNIGLYKSEDILESTLSYHRFVAAGMVFEKGSEQVDLTMMEDELLRRCAAYQMPACHIQREGRKGITIVNIGVGPSNAKTMTDCLAVLRPHCWLMVGHCAGLDGRMKIGDMIVANSFERQDLILDRHVPLGRPIPGLSEVQLALEQACRKIRKLEVNSPKMHNVRTGTVLTVADRNWEWRTAAQIRKDLQGSTSIALDMETATIATNGYRFRVPYGSLLSVSDKPLHNEPKLPQAARSFYRSSRAEHIMTAIYALEAMMKDPGSLHSRKLRRALGEVSFR